MQDDGSAIEREVTAKAPVGEAGGPSILARAALGMGWIVAWRMATRVLGLVNTLVLIRLLAPADFGLVALGTSFILAIDTLSTIGVEDALVREHTPTAAMYDTAFTMAALRSLATTLIIAVAAIPIAAFFAEPRLAHILWALAAGTLIAGIGSIGVVDFRRDMAFEKEFLLQILPRLVSISVSIGTALIWHSYWALVAGILTGRIVRTLFGYRMHSWRPRFTLSAWRDLIGFSLWIWAISLTELVRDRMDMFVLGRVLSPTAVGVYAIGDEVAFLPSTEVVAPLCRACFSAFAAARRAGQDVGEAFMRPVATTFLITFPAGLGISLVADPLVHLIMGEKWIAAIPIIEMLGIIGALNVFGLVASTLLSAHALLRPQFSITLICLGLRFALLILLVRRFGIAGAAIGCVLGVVFEHSMFMVVVFRQFALSVAELVRRIWRTIAAGLIMAVVLITTGLGWSHIAGDITRLTLVLTTAVVVGAAVYTAALLALWWLSGRPRGAEADGLAVVVRLVRSLIGRRRPVGPELM